MAFVAVPVVLTQHMPATFTPILAEHLTRLGGMPCAEAKDGEALLPGRIYLAPGDRHLLVQGTPGALRARITTDAPENFCRPAVEAGERLGFLPGDMKDKVDPYLRPIYDALHDMLPPDVVEKKIESGEIEIAPLAFMRGRTLSNAFVILDEAQNTTPSQMKMFLTRMGESARMVITGDLSQTDLPNGVKSGLLDAVETISGIDEIKFIQFDRGDVVRHPLVGKIVQAYDERK